MPDPQDHLEPAPEMGWAPRDLTDGRERFEWKSRYPAEALWYMKAEAAYLLGLLFLVPLLLLISAAEWPHKLLGQPFPAEKYRTFLVLFWGWLGGTLGGTLFALKWLYHSRAKGLWNIDRIFWRLFTPHLSAGLAFAFVTIVASGLFRVFSEDVLQKPLLSFALAFLVGYFSDTAIAKLTEVAETVFGPTRQKLVSAHPSGKQAPQQPVSGNPAGNSHLTQGKV